MRRIDCKLLVAIALSFALGCSPNSGSRGTGHGSGNGNNNGNGSGNGNGTGNGNGNGNGSGDSGDGGSGEGNCGVQNFMLMHGNPPDLLIVQDRSGSMSQDPSGNMPSSPSQSKWSQITAAIIQTVQNLQGQIQWGLLMFPDATASDPLTGACAINANLDVAIGPNNAAAITNSLNGTMPGGSTPTTAAVNAASAYFNGSIDNDGHPKYLLLATDGEPNCAANAGPFGGDDSTAAEAAIAAAAQSGIHTFVVGIGTDTTEDATLTAMAMNGMEPNMTPGAKAYYEVTSTNDLVTVINKIAGQIVSCSFDLQMPPNDPNLVDIQSNGMSLPRDPMHMNGWDFGPGNMSIVFYGPACMALQQGVTSSISAVYNCPVN